MIGKIVKYLVREGELTKIENYDKAVADETQLWNCHHRLELTLDGEFAHSQEDLIRMGMYYNRPYFELIFLTHSEHSRLHGNSRSIEYKNKMSETLKGRKFNEETKKKLSEASKRRYSNEEGRKKLSEALKGRKLSEEHRKNIGKASKGRKLSEETKKKISKALKRLEYKPKGEFSRKYFEYFGYSRAENPKHYQEEYSWYRKHDKKCRWE